MLVFNGQRIYILHYFKICEGIKVINSWQPIFNFGFDMYNVVFSVSLLNNMSLF